MIEIKVVQISLGNGFSVGNQRNNFVIGELEISAYYDTQRM